MATAYGAKIIEKHFTIDKNYSNFRDHKLSADTSEMTKLVNSVRKVKQMIGKMNKLISRGEKKNFSSMRRSLYFKNKMMKNSKILKK